MTSNPFRRKPARPYFSSGPCAKPPGWEASKLQTECLGRSHRAKIGKSRLQLAIDLMREVLQVPDTHRIGIVPGSDTGAYRNGDVDDAGRASGDDDGVGKLWRRLGHRCRSNS